MPTDFETIVWSARTRSALTTPQIDAFLQGSPSWQLNRQPTGELTTVQALEKTFHFKNYFETLAFVNALAMVAHREDHHPDLSVHYNRCVVRWSTHDVGGVSATDVLCAQAADALLKPQTPSAAV